jgi:hypothetical protein
MNYIALFFTHSGAIKFSNKLKKMGIKHDMMPAPRKLSTSCGVSVRFIAEDFEDFVISDIDKIYQIENSNYILKYSSDS